MAAGDARFVFFVELALGATITGNPNTWSWTEVTDDVGGDQITIRRGRADRYSETGPDTCELTFLNDAGKYVPRNPLSPFYGRLTRGTALRVLVQPQINAARDAFNRAASSSWGTADAGGVWTNVGGAGSDFSVAAASGGRHLHTAANAIHQSTLNFNLRRVDITVRVRVNALSTGASQRAGIICRYFDSVTSRRADLVLATSGAITAELVERAGGVETTTESKATGLTHSASTWYWMRLQTGSTSVRLKVWADGTDQPDTWLIDGADGAAFPTSPFEGRVGLVSRREVGNTNSNATTDFDDFTMADGPRIQFTGFVTGWPTTWADSALTQSYAPVTAMGQLRRLGRTQPLRSAIYRAATRDIAAASPVVVGYWPMEDGTASTSFASALGGQPMSLTGDVRPAADSAVVGSAPLPVLGGTGRFAAVVPPYAASSTWAVRWVMKIPASSISAAAQIMSWLTPGGNPIVRWQLTLTPGTPDTGRLDGFNSAGTAVYSTAAFNLVDVTSGAEMTDGRQLAFQADATQNGANIDLSWQVFAVPDDGTLDSAGLVGAGASGSTAATIGNVTYIYHDAPNGFANGGHTIGHVGVGRDPAFGFANGVGATGGAAEAASDRFQDLLTELGIVGFLGDLVRGSGSTSARMGPAGAGDVLAQLREVEATEQGLLYDGKQGFVHLLPRAMRLTRPVDLTLDVDLGHVGWPFSAVDDDQLLRNDVVVTNLNGSSARSIDRTSIDLEGVHADPIRVNAYKDSDLQPIADWRKNLGIAEVARYPVIVVNLTASHLALATAWCDTDIGSRIQVVNVPTGELPPEDLDLIVEGYTETISSMEWRAELNTTPISVWLAGVWDAGRKWDCGACTTAEALDTTETGIDVAIADTCTWGHATGNYDVMIGGERMTVTAVSAPVGAGASWTQTLTVTRSVNGIVKTHAIGAEVHLADPFIWGL